MTKDKELTEEEQRMVAEHDLLITALKDAAPALTIIQRKLGEPQLPVLIIDMWKRKAAKIMYVQDGHEIDPRILHNLHMLYYQAWTDMINLSMRAATRLTDNEKELLIQCFTAECRIAELEAPVRKWRAEVEGEEYDAAEDLAETPTPNNLH